MVGTGVSVGGTAVGGTAVGGTAVGGTAVGWITGAVVGWTAAGPTEQLSVRQKMMASHNKRVNFLLCILSPWEMKLGFGEGISFNA